VQNARKNQVCFTLTSPQLDRLENYMVIHHIPIRADAMNDIFDEWIKDKQELETLRTYIKDKFPETKKTLEPQECLRGMKFSGNADQVLKCRNCNRDYHDHYIECQKMKGFMP